MCGTAFCGQCTPTTDIIAYYEGRRHTLPVFGDGAQRSVTMHKRRELFMSYLRGNSAFLADWPEYYRMYSLVQHLNRMGTLGERLTYIKDAPESLRIALASEKSRILTGNISNRRKRFMPNDGRRVLRRWIRENLAEAELAILGGVFYSKAQTEDEPLLQAA